MANDNLLSVFDFETTGLDPTNDRIVEVGIVTCRISDGSVIEKYGELVSGITVPDDAARIHGLTTEKLNRDGMPWRVVRKRMVKRLERVPNWCAYNADFDVSFIESHTDLRRRDFRIIDPLEIVYSYVPADRLEKKNTRGLSNVARSFGVSLEHAHRAVADADATREVLFRILEETQLSIDEWFCDSRPRLGPLLWGEDPFEAIYIPRPNAYKKG